MSVIAAQRTPWLLCEACLDSLANLDKPEARKHALRWWESDGQFEPPGSGPALREMVNVGTPFGPVGCIFAMPLSSGWGFVLRPSHSSSWPLSVLARPSRWSSWHCSSRRSEAGWRTEAGASFVISSNEPLRPETELTAR